MFISYSRVFPYNNLAAILIEKVLWLGFYVRRLRQIVMVAIHHLTIDDGHAIIVG